MRTFSTLLVAGAITLVLTACTMLPMTESAPMMEGGSMAGMDHSNMPMDDESPFDAMFIDSMIEHHQGAIDMSQALLEVSEQPELRALAEEIIAAQTAEIAEMQSWRADWFADLPPTVGMDMAMGDMQISDDESLPLEQRFLQAMISHHIGALHMAEMALEMSERAEIRTLAEAIIVAQNAEIEQMQGWLAEWYGVTE